MGTNNERSTFLFARPSFLSGMARVLDLGANLQIYNESRSAEEADRLALTMDWFAVGDDIQESMRKYESQEQTLAATAAAE